MILIGSRALALRANQVLSRNPKDFDFICTFNEYESWLAENSSKISPTKIYASQDDKKMIVEGKSNCEFEIVKSGSSSEMFYNLVKEDKETFDTKFGSVPNLDLLFTLKSSHKYLKNSPHFWKNLSDYHRMKIVGAVVRPEYKEFLRLREKETYTYNHPSLTNQTKESFFSAAHGVQYTFDHDSLHEAVKYLEKPAYKYYAKDNDQIKSDKEKFFASEQKIRVYGVIEESSVLALERALIPNFDMWTLDSAWLFAFSKVCTSITSGFFRSWAYENAFEILKSRPKDFYEKFQNGLKSGVVIPHQGKNDLY